MSSKKKIEELMEEAINNSSADETELVLMDVKEETTRFANSEIHQNVAEQDTQIIIRVFVEGKQGVAQENCLDNLNEAIERAIEIAKVQEKPVSFSLPEPQDAQKVDSYDEEVYELKPARRAELAGQVIKVAKKYKLNAAGALTSGGMRLFVKNSKGVNRFHKLSNLHLDTVMTGRKFGSGYAEFSSYKLADFSPEEQAEIAARKTLESEERSDIELGKYTVILEEAAVATMLSMLAYMGLSGKAVNEKRSFMCDNFGKQLVADKVTIYDDGLDPNTLPLPFDFEGVPKQKIYFFKAGVATDVVYDTRTAVEGASPVSKKRSTGHALPATQAAFGPFPLNIAMEPGDSSLAEMLENTERGIWITRFHYARPVDHRKSIVTMMTRDGTFFIEQGKVKEAITDLRVTQSILEALKNVELISKSRKLITGSEAIGSLYVPILKIREFNFTGRTSSGFEPGKV